MRHWSLRVAVALALVFLVAFIAVAGLVFLLIAANLHFSALWGPVAGALVVSAGLFVAAGSILWIATKILR